METVVLKCGTDIVLHACDTNWTADAVSPSVDAVDFKQGTGSVSFTASGTGLQCHATISSTDISGKTHIQLWIKAGANTTASKFTLRVSITTDCSASYDELNLPALTANVWTLLVLELSIASSLTAVKSIGLVQNVAGDTAVHIDSVLAVSAESYDTYGVRGFDDVDRARLWPGVMNECPDGERRVSPTAYGRKPEFRIAPGTTKAARVWLVTPFALASTKAMIYANEEMPVVFEDGETPFSSEWLKGTPIGRAYPITLCEKSIRATSPASWS